MPGHRPVFAPLLLLALLLTGCGESDQQADMPDHVPEVVVEVVTQPARRSGESASRVVRAVPTGVLRSSEACTVNVAVCSMRSGRNSVGDDCTCSWVKSVSIMNRTPARFMFN